MQVLILVVVDDGLVQLSKEDFTKMATRLNPCCSGRWSRTVKHSDSIKYCDVLILVVVDDGLVQISVGKNGDVNVLILVVVDDGLVL